jgi:hypothetical protein
VIFNKRESSESIAPFEVGERWNWHGNCRW